MYGFVRPFRGDEILFFTICKETSDFPDHVTMRCHAMLGSWQVPAPICGVYDSLDAARGDVPQGAYRFDRSPQDDPVIVESWML